MIFIPPLIAALAYAISDSYGLYTSEVGVTFIAIVIGFEFYLLYQMRKNSSGDLKQADDSDNNLREVDFSKVPAVMSGDAPKPIDKTGNVYLHNEETLTEDMANIGIDRHGEE